MQVNLYNQNADAIGTVELPDSIFGVDSNNDLLYQVTISQMSNKRQVIAHAKSRSEVRGGGKKPWRQKGTGRARHGSIRSPIWKGGGVTFGPTKEANFEKKIGKKMLRKALAVALSEKVRSNNVFVVDDIKLSTPKTKEAAAVLKLFREKFNDIGSTLIITPLNDKKLNRSTRNIQKTGVIEARNLSPLEVLSYKSLVMLKESVKEIEKLRN